VYVRHGAKSEPATSHDLERIIERRLRDIVPDAVGPAPVRITTDPAAPTVTLADPDRTHPHRLKEFLAAVNARLRPLGAKANGYDVRATLAVQSWEKDLANTWKAERGPRKYRDAFAEWLVKEVARDKHFVSRPRARWRRMPPRPRPAR
jgi:hypothetical protein